MELNSENLIVQHDKDCIFPNYEGFWFKRCCKLVFSLLYWESTFYYKIYTKRDNRKSNR